MLIDVDRCAASFLRLANWATARYQSRATGGEVPFESDFNTIDEMVLRTAGYRAAVMPCNRAAASVSDTCNRYTTNPKMTGSGGDNLSPMRSLVSKANYLLHSSSFIIDHYSLVGTGPDGGA